MALLNGTATYTRFRLLGDLPDGFEERFVGALERHAFKEIDPDADVERHLGWVRWGDAFDSSWEPHTLVNGDGVMVLTLRIDTLKVPPVTLKAYVAQAEREMRRKLSRERLTKPERDMLRIEVQKKLRRRSLPKMQLVEVVANLSTGEARLFSSSKRVVADFQDLFHKTFGLRAIGSNPLTVLWGQGFSDLDQDQVIGLEPERFHQVPE